MILNHFTETHCHILPGIDDGSPDVETSISMIERLRLQGAQTIIVTPHYYSDSISLQDFLTRRNAAYEKLAAALPDTSPKIVPGAEIFISRYLFSNDDLSGICFGKERYALIEHPFSETFGEKAYERLVTLICDHGITPILAHIERYSALMDSVKTLDSLLELGCLTQVNISSFADERRSVKKKLFKYLESGRIHLIGSDCHNLSSRPPAYEDGAKEIIKKCGRATLEKLLNNSNELLQ